MKYADAEQLLQTSYRMALSKKASTRIMQDAEHTFPNIKYFNRNEGSIGVTLIVNILQAVATHRPKVGYVVGMNFIAASLLYHSCRAIAFWVMVQLIDEYKLDEIYETGCPGLVLHSRIIEMLLCAKDESKKIVMVFVERKKR